MRTRAHHDAGCTSGRCGNGKETRCVVVLYGFGADYGELRALRYRMAQRPMQDPSPASFLHNQPARCNGTGLH